MPEPRTFLLWSRLHQQWWKPNSRGYSPRLEEAGWYTRDEARDREEASRPRGEAERTIAVDAGVLQLLGAEPARGDTTLLGAVKKCAAYAADHGGTGEWGAGLSEYARCQLVAWLLAAIAKAESAPTLGDMETLLTSIERAEAAKPPHYAYGDNEAACWMAEELASLAREAAPLLAALRSEGP